MGPKEAGRAFLMGALPILIIGIGGRATDNMVSTTLPLLGKYVFNLGTWYGGIATSVYGISGVFASYVVNPRISGGIRRRVFIASTGVIALFCLLLAVSDALTAMALGLLISFAFGLVYPSIITASSLAGGLKGERFLALFTLGLSTSLVLGPALETYVLGYSYVVVFVVFAAVSTVAFLASWRVTFVTVPMEAKKPGPSAKAGVLAGVLVSSVFFLPFAAFTAFLPIYAAQVFGTGASLAYASFVPLFTVSFLARAYMVAWPFKSFRFPILASIVITCLGILAMVAAPSFLVFLVVMAFIGIPHGITYTSALIIVSRKSEEGERNVAVSRFTAYSSLLGSLVPLGIGGAIELVGIHLSFLLLLLPALLCAALFIRWFWSTTP